MEAHGKFISTRRTKAMDDGLVSLADSKSHQILKVQIETAKPEPPILAFARDYFKVNAKFVAKSKKNQTETKEERRIPKPNSKSSTRSGISHEDVFGAPLFSKEDPEEDESNEEVESFKTKFDESPETNGEEPREKTKKQKRNEQKKQKSQKRKVAEKEKGSKKQKTYAEDVEDELVDFDFDSD
jgi:hypothetical protein